MNIVVCIKQTPDTAAMVAVKDGHVTWGDAALVINPWDEYAVEEALRSKRNTTAKSSRCAWAPRAVKNLSKLV